MKKPILLEVTGNSFGDQIIRIWINGQVVEFVQQEGDWVNPEVLIEQLDETESL